MLKRALAFVLGAAMAAVVTPASAEDLLQIYRDALANDPTLASARANWLATQEAVPQARAGLLPPVTLVGNANAQNVYEKLHTDPSLSVTENFPAYNYTVSASQPLYRKQNLVALDQAKQTVGQSDYVLASARQDLIIRVAQAYLDVLLARFNIELTESQKAAVSENLAQAKRNFEVGTATITDTNDAQAKYDQIVAQEISTQNDLDNKLAVLRAIIGRAPKELKPFGGEFAPQPPTPNTLDAWIEAAVRDNPQVRIAQANYDIAVLEVDKQRAGHYPTLDLVANFNQSYAGATPSVASSVSSIANDSRFQGAASGGEPGEGPAGPRNGTPQRAAFGANCIQRRLQRSGAGYRLRAGGQIGAGLLRFDQARTRSRGAHQSRRSEPATTGLPDAIQPGPVVLQFRDQRAQAQAGSRHALRSRRRRTQSGARRVRFPIRCTACAASCGASHSHRRSAAPRCIA